MFFHHPQKQTHAVDPDFLLLPGDALFFAGDVRVAPALAADKGLALVPVTADAAAAGAKTSALLPPPPQPLEASKAFGSRSPGGSDAAPQAPLALLEEGGGAPLLPSNSKLIQAVIRYKVRFCCFSFLFAPFLHTHFFPEWNREKSNNGSSNSGSSSGLSHRFQPNAK